MSAELAREIIGGKNDLHIFFQRRESLLTHPLSKGNQKLLAPPLFKGRQGGVTSTKLN